MSEKYTTSRKTKTRNVNMSLDSSHLQERSETSRTGPSESVHVIVRMTEEVKEAPEDRSQSPEEESRPLVQYGFDD